MAVPDERELPRKPRARLRPVAGSPETRGCRVRKAVILWDAVRCQLSRLIQPRLTAGDIQDRALRLGHWLQSTRYVGVDVRSSNRPALISTVPAFAMLGWSELERVVGDRVFQSHAEECLDILLASQSPKGTWAFPYPFRSNPPGHVYACENLMTVSAMLRYAELTGQPGRVQDSVTACLCRLRDEIGDHAGAFWYSATDRIEVPNISSMAANAYATAGARLSRPDFLDLASRCSQYCLSRQNPDGSYPYQIPEPDIYVPYHALETWELIEANRVLGDETVSDSTARAVSWLREFLNERGYRSFDSGPDSSRLMKTPVWSAKAFWRAGDLREAHRHLAAAMRLFAVPRRPQYCYLVRKRWGALFPDLATDFIRHNASLFEISASYLRSEMAREGEIS